MICLLIAPVPLHCFLITFGRLIKLVGKAKAVFFLLLITHTFVNVFKGVVECICERCGVDQKIHWSFAVHVVGK